MRPAAADVTGDGRGDAVVMFPDGNWYVVPSTGSGFTRDPATWQWAADGIPERWYSSFHSLTAPMPSGGPTLKAPVLPHAQRVAGGSASGDPGGKGFTPHRRARCQRAPFRRNARIQHRRLIVLNDSGGPPVPGLITQVAGRRLSVRTI